MQLIFHILNLYPAVLLNSLMSGNGFVFRYGILRFCTYEDYVHITEIILLLLFQLKCLLFFLLSSCSTRTPGTTE